LIDPLEKLLGYKVTKEHFYYLLVLVALAIKYMEIKIYFLRIKRESLYINLCNNFCNNFDAIERKKK